MGTTAPTGKPAQHRWIHQFLRLVRSGRDFLLILAVIGGIFAWYGAHSRREKPWSRNDVSATFAGVSAQRSGPAAHLLFHYALANNSTRDYTLPPPPQGALMTDSPGAGLEPLNSASWKTPLTIPAGQTVNAQFDVSFDPREFGANPAELDSEEALSSFLAHRLREINGLAFFDYADHLRIDLPKGW